MCFFHESRQLVNLLLKVLPFVCLQAGTVIKMDIPGLLVGCEQYKCATRTMDGEKSGSRQNKNYFLGMHDAELSSYLYEVLLHVYHILHPTITITRKDAFL